MKNIVLILFLFVTQNSFGQNSFKAVIKKEKTNELLQGANAYIPKLNLSAISNEKGEIVFTNIPNGEYEIEFSYVGFQSLKKKFTFPLKNTADIIDIELEPGDTPLGDVIVTTTRSGRSIKNLPTRVEAITADELDEKGTMKPGDIKMLLNESTGIATQQTSAVSGTANIRIQGLDGRYTQVLKDGMPLYNGFSGRLSIMQITPLDLQQVEFIKGSASTLYGGGAIAGLVNLISKTPQEKKELSFLLNGTTAKGADASGFYSQRFGKLGTTVFTSYNYNAPYDPASIGLTSIPKTNRFTINPKLFFYPNTKTKGYFGINTTYENRYGGDIKVLEGKADNIHQYFEKNISLRMSTQFNLEHKINDESKIQLKNSVAYFDRKLSQPNTSFHGQQVSSFTEFNYVHNKEKSEWVTGVNIWTDNLKSLNTSHFNYHLATFGVFAQNIFKATEWFSLESGLRIDYNTPATNNKLKGLFILPRVNALFKINNHFSSRIGGGLGYKMPSPFTEEAEEKSYRDILPIDIANTKAEQSYGGNADVNFKTQAGEFSLSINQLFFYTYLNDPVVLQGNNFINANGYINTKGTETNFKIGYGDFKLYAGYTFTDTRQHFDGKNLWQPLTAKHRLYTTLTYEKENSFRTGIEGYYVSEQQLSDGTTGRGYVLCGFLFEKIWKHINIYINAENLTDRRQTKWDTIYTGTITSPTFKDIYAPTDGVIINSGVKIKL